jgi:ADP-heptose:LPS heptosyltransferase
MAGIPDTPPSELSWLKADVARYRLTTRYVLMVVGGSPHRPEKIWPAERFGTLGRDLVAQGYTPVVLGTTPERPMADAIRAACPEARDLTGDTSFAELAQLARGAAAAIGGVTGPMHLLAAAGAPSVVMFSRVSDPAQCGPRGRKVAYLQKDSLADLPVSEAAAALRDVLTP